MERWTLVPLSNLTKLKWRNRNQKKARKEKSRTLTYSQILRPRQERLLVMSLLVVQMVNHQVLQTYS